MQKKSNPFYTSISTLGKIFLLELLLMLHFFRILYQIILGTKTDFIFSLKKGNELKLKKNYSFDK